MALGVAGLWAISGLLMIGLIGSSPERGSFGDMFGAVNALFSGLAFAGVAVALLMQHQGLQLNLLEISKAHEWNRRRSAHELTSEGSLGKFGEIRRRFEADESINIWDTAQTTANLVGADGHAKTLTREQTLQLDAILNFLENVCLSIKNGVVDEEIVYRALSSIMVAYFRWARPYIEQHRSNIDSAFWIEIDPFEHAWQKRAMREAEAAAVAEQQATADRLARQKEGRGGV